MNSFRQIDYYPDLKKQASRLAANYGLKEASSANIDYAWLGREFAIVFVLDRDGADLRYVDLGSNAPQMYLLGHFLMAKRRTVEIAYPRPPQELKPATLIALELDYLLKLLEASPDILRGEREWLTQEYDLERLRVPSNWLDSLRALQADTRTIA